MRRIAVLLLVVGAVSAQSPTPGPEWKWGVGYSCQENLRIIPEIERLTTSDDVRRTIEIMGPDKAQASVGSDAARHAVEAISTCPRGPKRDLLRAFALSWRGFAEHYQGDDRWRDDLNLADQLFQKCVTANSGTELGARCATAMETNARWRRAWGG